MPVRSGAFNYSGIMFCAYISHFALGDLLGVFITSVLSACVESMFVIMQRYNRPRVIKMIEKKIGRCVTAYGIFEVVEKRRTVRDFENEEISMDIIEKIIGAGLKAPTNDHMRDWHYIVIRDKSVVLQLLDIIPKGISEEDMNQLIKDWNLSDNEQQEAYRNAVPKQHKMLLDASVIVIPLLKQKQIFYIRIVFRT